VGKSTVTTLLATTYDWFTHLEAGRDIGSVFFGLQKGFDTVPHRALMTKLQQLNVSPFILRWICSYLTARQQKVVIGEEESETIPVISGVLQGSVLGPLLFLIYIDDVARVSLSEGSTLVLYTDDMLLYTIEKWIAQKISLLYKETSVPLTIGLRRPTLPSVLQSASTCLFPIKDNLSQCQTSSWIM